MALEHTTYHSPIGPLAIVECERGPLVVEFPRRAESVAWSFRLRAKVPAVPVEPGPCARTTAWLDAYFAGEPKPFPFPEYLKHWFSLTQAQVDVFRALRRIPLGETRSYDDIARETGLIPRQIGQLVGGNHLAIFLPCHRVVGKDGSLVGYGGGLPAKRWLLDHELRASGVLLR